MANNGLSPGKDTAKTDVRYLLVDIKIRSNRDLKKYGAYKRVMSPNSEPMIFNCNVNGGPPITVDLLQGEKIPQNILDALIDSKVKKYAYNANYVRVFLSHYLSGLGIILNPDNPSAQYLNPASWRCLRVWAAALGLPQSFEDVVKVLGMECQELVEDKSLIRFFCVPCRATEDNDFKKWNMPADAPGAWAKIKENSARKIEAQLQLLEWLSKQPLPEFCWNYYSMSEMINDRGIRVDMPFVRSCISLNAQYTKKLTETMQALTELENPSNGLRLKEWLAMHGCQMDSLDKKAVEARVETASPEVAQVLRLWLKLQVLKNSVKNYDAMADVAGRDSRIRGTFKFFGARTGRLTCDAVQFHSFPKNHIRDLALARALVASGVYESVEKQYDDPPDILSQLTRTALIPQDGRKFIVADFNAIEARIVAWLAEEQWKMDAFERGEDIYCATASQMFGVKVEKNGVNGELRAMGKVAELACSYGGSTNALKEMDALEMGLKEEELEAIVKSWRRANRKIVDFWLEVHLAAKNAIKNKTQTSVGRLKFSLENGTLFITLPSGRRLAYANARMGTNRFGRAGITYEGTGKKGKWERLETYGPKLVENIVQGISLDILLYAMGTLRHYWIVAHTHDEILAECARDEPLKVFCRRMSQTPPWAPGLSLRADGYECEFYRKD